MSNNMLNPVSWLPEKYLLLAKILAVVLLIIAAKAWWYGHNTGQQQIGYDRAAAEYQAELATQKDVARQIEREWKTKYEGAVNDRTEAEKRLAQSRAAAADATDRLRRSAEDFSRRLSGSTLDACRSAASAAAGLLSECSAAYRDMAAAADGHFADVRQCESAWPK